MYETRSPVAAEPEMGMVWVRSQNVLVWVSDEHVCMLYWLVSRLVRRSPQRDPSLRDIRDSEAALSITLADACAPAGQVDGTTPHTPLSGTIPVS